MVDVVLKQVVKRDGRITPYVKHNITSAIAKAGKETGEFSEDEASRLTDIIHGILGKVVAFRKEHISVEQVQDTVEQVLMAAGHFSTAKAYILYRAEHTKLRNAVHVIGVENDLDLSINQLKVIERRYLLHDQNGKPIETPSQMFRRVAKTLAGVEKKAQRKKWEENFYEVMRTFSFLPAGRTLNNAGTPQSQLANCFVLPIEDSMEGIFDSVKWTALVHRTGGGCIAEGSYIYTSFCGLEKFEVLYERLGGKEIEVGNIDNGWKIDVKDKKIYTLALDQHSCQYIKDKILSIWRYELPAERIYTIKARGGLEITTSDWHPFFVYENDQIIEKKSEDIHVGDLIFSGNPSIVENWLFKEYNNFEKHILDEDIGWLAGYILGDGSFGKAPNTSKKKVWKKVRLRLFDGDKKPLEKAANIFEKLTGNNHKIQKDTRSQCFYLTVCQQETVIWLQKMLDIYGPKDHTLHVPSQLIKSPVSVVCSVLAGLLDSDGHVVKNRQRIEFDSESSLLIEQIVDLLTMLGIHSSSRKKVPKNSNWHDMYQVRVDGEFQIQRLFSFLSPYISSDFKKQRILQYPKLYKPKYGFKSLLSFSVIEPFLIKAGVKTRGSEIHKSAVSIGEKKIWLHRLKWKMGISSFHIIEVIDALLGLSCFSQKERGVLERWKIIHMSVCPVVDILRPQKGGIFYDFTTEKHHNYLAGRNGLAVVHNTGFNFTPLRPKGDGVTKSSGGFATGPVSFMKVFDVATKQVMQGGKQRGANMGILAVNHPDILEFIGCKSEEGEISNFNISVGATDEFMQAVEKDGVFGLRNPRTQEIVQKISARMLMDHIVSLAWRTGDPGMIYWDTINKNNPLRDSVGPIYATNPCVTGETIVATPSGWRMVSEIHEGDEIYTIKGVGKVRSIETHEDVEIFQVRFSDNTYINATAAHQFFASKWEDRDVGIFIPIRLDNLKQGDIVQRYKTPLEKKDIPTYGRIVSIKPNGTAKVYDLYEPESDTWITDSYVSRGCGEQPLHSFDACNLGSINLSAFVVEKEHKKNSKKKHGEKEIDWERLASVVSIATRMLDNVIDACKYPLKDITYTVRQNRRIGLGVMGWADMLVQLGIPYNSEEAISLAEKVMGFIQKESWNASENLAKEKGVFPRWKHSWFAKGYDPVTHTYSKKKKPRKLRNLAITTIAPTGTISMAANCSSGIEPLFALSFVKNVVDDSGLMYVNTHFEKALRSLLGQTETYTSVLTSVAHSGSVSHIDAVPQEIRKVFVTAHDIAWTFHVRMQAAFQKYTDNAVSKTINFPSTATLDEVKQVYLLAWKLGCKGITVYRDTSKQGQVLSVSSQKKEKKTDVIIQSKVRVTPLSERKDFEAFVKQEIVKGDVVDIDTQEELCPECNTMLQFMEGCCLCPNCGYSKCTL